MQKVDAVSSEERFSLGVVIEEVVKLIVVPQGCPSLQLIHFHSPSIRLLCNGTNCLSPFLMLQKPIPGDVEFDGGRRDG